MSQDRGGNVPKRDFFCYNVWPLEAGARLGV